jgi:hypothetical protein
MVVVAHSHLNCAIVPQHGDNTHAIVMIITLVSRQATRGTLQYRDLVCPPADKDGHVEDVGARL